jgi:hypothetical protein
VDQLLTPRGLVLTLASFLGEGGVVFNPVRLRARGSCWWVGVVFFERCGCAILGVVFFERCVCAICVVVFFVWEYLTLALFWGRFGLPVFVVG